MDVPDMKESKEIEELKLSDSITELDKRDLDNTVAKNLSAELGKDGISNLNVVPNDVKLEKGEEICSKDGFEETKEDKLESNESQSEKICIKTESYAENCDNNDESMILTIEEDEQKLMHEEAQDTLDKEKRENDTNSKAKEKNNTDEKSRESNKSEENISDTLNEKEKDLEESSTVNSKPKTTTSSRNLWISGLSTITRASDLKLIFSKYGKVVGAKVVTNTRTPGTRCYGYVTMSSSSEATRCIQHLHCTELHGRIISVERTKNEVGNTPTTNSRIREDRKSSEKSFVKFDSDKTDTEKKVKSECDDKASGDKLEIKNSQVKKENAEEKTSDYKQKVLSSSYKSKSRSSRSSSSRNNRAGIRSDHKKEKNVKTNVLSYERIREERERQRLRERERALREEERRRIEIRRRQREEEQRLIREREKLAIEREKIEKEKAELLRMERERQKLEREKIELEKMELKRQQKSLRLINSTRIDENKRIKRMTDERFAESSIERKRRLDRGERRIEAPPPPRFDSSADSSYEKKRESLNSKRNDYISPILKSDDYISLKREYSSLNKREEYQKRDVDDRHSSYSREDNKQNRYEQTSYRSNRANVDDNRNSTISNKRYEISDHYDRNSSINSSNNWQHSHGLSSSGHGMSSIHGGSSINPIKSFVGNGMQSSSIGNSLNWSNKISDDTHWVGRNSENNQDRYDRTYNERSNSSSYIDNGNRSSAYNIMGSGRSMQDRFGSSLARYDSTKY